MWVGVWGWSGVKTIIFSETAKPLQLPNIEDTPEVSFYNV